MNQKEHDLKILNLKLLAWKGQVRSNVSESFNLSLVESLVIDAMELCGAHSRIEALQFSSISVTWKCDRTRDFQSPPADILIP